ncbi:neuroligin-4, X-linked-like isoform X1 [Odontomachus brunneus]|uniref:neuroligin-4, X-linked-like isoform X1 n=1 Tax=Odontomachus brunneus TaxID=486640 RepID=UPI0013F1BCA8|nr:neuroligin-4, X-linked-like isoform X1 [Odontomachus brunneus]
MDTDYMNSIRHTVVVEVQQGKLLGSIKEGVLGSMYKAFLGIPYAAPPIGSLRFRDPQPPVSWKDIRVATDDMGVMSAQLCRKSPKNVIGTEDCLYLNVYVPYEQCEEVLHKAVMVWIHGGNFHYGSGNYSEIRPDYFMKKDVILVTINYRLGILGFLNLGHKHACGNQGLKDQIAALEWIKENIFNFGGSPDKITVFGNGTGAISTHLLMLSPLSKGLFQKAILQSGVALCNWAIKEKQTEGFELASKLGCSSKELETILAYLHKIPYRVLVLAEATIVSEKKRRIRKVIFGPTIDKESLNPFLPCPVRELFENNNNNIPILIGHNTDEIFESYPQMTDEKALKDEDLTTYVEIFAGQHNLDKVPNYTKQILKHYGQVSSFKTWHSDVIKRCLSDLYYNHAIRSVVINRAEQKMKTYFYLFSYNGDEKKIKEHSTESSDTMSNIVTHGDELAYLFYMPDQRNKNLFAMTRKDYDIINMITLIWSNFAKEGDPNFETTYGDSDWKDITSKNELMCFEINRQPSGWIKARKHLILTDKWY